MAKWINVREWLPGPYEDVLLKTLDHENSIRYFIGFCCCEDGENDTFHMCIPKSINDEEDTVGEVDFTENMYIKVTHWTLLED